MKCGASKHLIQASADTSRPSLFFLFPFFLFPPIGRVSADKNRSVCQEPITCMQYHRANPCTPHFVLFSPPRPIQYDWPCPPTKRIVLGKRPASPEAVSPPLQGPLALAQALLRGEAVWARWYFLT
ncbi:unnamed protein product [Discosporangium mesarthrocarpum]